MRSRILPYLLVGITSAVVTTMFQPLSYLPTLAQGNCQTFRETGKVVCGRFLQYWQQNGGLAQQGLPLSNEFTEVSELNGQSYTVQYFERAVFEKHPENKAPYDVLLSQLGTFQFKRKYPNGEPSTSQPPSTGGKMVQLGEEFEITPGVRLAWRTWAANAGSSCKDKLVIYWGLQLYNASDKPFEYVASKGNFTIRDSLGNVYPVSEYGGMIKQEVVPANGRISGSVETVCQQIFQGTTYIELVIDQISNIKGPFTFRRNIGR
jgi:hypothetical protein